MNTYIIILKSSKTMHSELNDHLCGQIIPALKALAPIKLKTVRSISPPPVHVIPFSKIPVACITIESEKDPRSTVDGSPFFFGAYHVSAAFPVSYEIDWPIEMPTPGACLLTLFRRKKNLPEKEFIDRWHNGHTPLSLKLHPLWNYNRNVVTETLHGPSFDGIVEEQMRTRADLLNPVRFFGGPLRMVPNMIRTLADTMSFIHYPTMETYLAEEIWHVA